MKTPDAKHWKQRKSGIMKKAHGMHWKFGAKVALYMERNGELFAYESHVDFAWEEAAVLATQILTPDDYVTLAQARDSRRSKQFTSTTSEQERQRMPAST